MKWLENAAIIAVFVVFFILSYCLRRSDFHLFFSLYSLWWGLYAFLYRRCAFAVKHQQIALFALPFVALLAAPQLSDDYFRYLWDGRLAALGINPYSTTPNDIIKNQLLTDSLLIELYPSLNSPSFFSVYPPVTQCFFALAAWGGMGQLTVSTVLLRTFWLGAHFLTFAGIQKQNKNIAFFYLCNPFVLIELVLNLHTEMLLLPALVWGIYFLTTQQRRASAACLALAIGIKLIPLLLLPLWALWRGTWRQALVYGLWLAFFLLLIFAPFFYNQDVAGIWASIRLYFTYFEFNGSLYYFFTRLLPWHHDALYMQVVKTVLPLLSLFAVVFITLQNRHKHDVLTATMLIFVAYYATASTVHPWYLTAVVVLGLLGQLLWTQVWAWAVALTYTTYAYIPYAENHWFIAVEYALVLGFVILFWRKKREI